MASMSESQRNCSDDRAAAIEETVNAEMISTLLVIYRIARRALSAEERVGQRIPRDARAKNWRS